MRYLIVYLGICVALFSEEINRGNIEKYVYTLPSKKVEFKVVKGRHDFYFLISLQDGSVVYRGVIQNNIDEILSYMRINKYLISRECEKLEMSRVGKEEQ